MEIGRARANKLQWFEYFFTCVHFSMESNQRKYNAFRLGWNANVLCHFMWNLKAHWRAAAAYHVLSSDNLLSNQHQYNTFNLATCCTLWQTKMESLHLMITPTLRKQIPYTPTNCIGKSVINAWWIQNGSWRCFARLFISNSSNWIA